MALLTTEHGKARYLADFVVDVVFRTNGTSLPRAAS
jgi:hypothetical protein